jgi:hypothetical protein
MKKQRNADLVDYLLRKTNRFTRGRAGRPKKRKSYGLYAFRSAGDACSYSSFFGFGRDYDLCRDLLFSMRHPVGRIKAKAKRAVSRRIQTALNTHNVAFFHRLADSITAVQESPFDPLGIAVGLAYKKHELKHDSEPTPNDLVTIAQDFFDLKDKEEKEFNSLRASLFRTAKKVLCFLAK